jgi:hypothetical protein
VFEWGSITSPVTFICLNMISSNHVPGRLRAR